MHTYFMGHEIHPDIGDYHVFCPSCIDAHEANQGLNDLDWSDLVDMCWDCMGTNRCPIPLAEVKKVRKIGNEQ